MKYRQLGKTGFTISEIALGTWQVGGVWGEAFDHAKAEKILNSAIDAGINFIDTADVYSDGLSEAAVGRMLKNRPEKIYVATKCGRKIQPHTSEHYTVDALRKFVEGSLRNMQLDTLDLVQLHCPPTEVYYRPEIFELFEQLKTEGKISKLGVSVEKVEEALKAIEYDLVDTVQIIFNIFRQRPAGLLFEQARKKNIGIIARVPLASGLLTGKFNKNSQFGAHDHRQFNRNGEAFDKGETFSGIDYEKGLALVDKLKSLFPDIALPMLALRWILQFEEVSCVIPGASSPEQIIANIAASTDETLSAQQMATLSQFYEEEVKPMVHQLW